MKEGVNYFTVDTNVGITGFDLENVLAWLDVRGDTRLEWVLYEYRGIVVDVGQGDFYGN